MEDTGTITVKKKRNTKSYKTLLREAKREINHREWWIVRLAIISAALFFALIVMFGYYNS